jgi:hypothetical protein
MTQTEHLAGFSSDGADGSARLGENGNVQL